jgi:TIR domain
LPRPRIFVSHSAREPEASELLGQLAEALRAADFDPYVADERIRRGDDFVDKLRGELSTCAGAVMMLSPRALKSHWVQQEAMVLTMRHAREKDEFPLLPLLICGTTREALKRSRLGVLGLPNLHAPRADPAVAVPEIVGMFQQLIGPPRPLHELELIIANLLDRVNDGLLQIVAEELEVDLAGWQPHGRQMTVARHLLCTDLFHFSRAMRKIADIIDKPIRFINIVFPFTWIDGRAAAPLAEAAIGTAPRPSLAINSDQRETVAWYVRRACARSETWPVVDPGVAEGESYDEALANHVRDAILIDILGYSKDDKVSDAKFAEELEKSEKRDGPIFVLLRRYVDATSVAKLQQRFPRSVFVVLAGPEAFGQPVTAGVPMLTPWLDPSVESESLDEYDKLIDDIDAQGRPVTFRSAGH